MMPDEVRQDERIPDEVEAIAAVPQSPFAALETLFQEADGAPSLDFFAKERARWIPSRRVLFFAIAAVSTIAFVTFAMLKMSLAVVPAYAATNQPVDKPFVIDLNQTLRSVPLNDITMTPRVAGSWRFISGALIGDDKLEFTPKSYFTAGTHYTVVFTKPAIRVLFGQAVIGKVQFETESAPGFVHNGLVTATNGSTIAADASFSVNLVAPNKGLRNLEMSTTPAVALEESVTGDQHYTWRLKNGLLPQGQPIVVTIVDTKNNVTLLNKTLTVATEPTITTPVQATHFVQGDVATIVFNEPMVTTDSSDIQFSLPGQGKWINSTTYAFTPTSVTPGQTYSYTLKQGLRSISGGIVTANETNSFSTTGAVQVTGSSPYGSSLTEAQQNISFTFDQPVDHASAQSHFGVSSGTVGSFSWSGNTMTATVTNLGYQHTVTASVGAGVTNAGFGLPSAQAFGLSFTTAPQIVKYNVPYYHQQYAGSCAAASLRMILAYYGIQTDDMTIVDRMGYNPTVENTSTNPPTWDDPWQMFVGSVDGYISKGTGAGPDSPPVAKAAQSFGRNASYVMGTNANWIAQQLYNGGLVEFFGAYSNTSFTSWQTPSGRIEKMNLTSHAYAITGVEGSVANPIGFWVSDPINGPEFWTTAKLDSQLSMDAYQQAVVVY